MTRVFAISDLHIDFSQNKKWLYNLSFQDYTDDILLLGGDITHIESLFKTAMAHITSVFNHVIFVPGNHDAWVSSQSSVNSLEKIETLLRFCESLGVHIKPVFLSGTLFIPLFAWYDYSFGSPDSTLGAVWNDFQRCRWPVFLDSDSRRTDYFLGQNSIPDPASTKRCITLSHFLPRIDLMPDFIPQKKRIVYPVLGTQKLDTLLQKIKPQIHVYGHSHVNNIKTIDKTRYINNAFGYPHEKNICARELAHICDI